MNLLHKIALSALVAVSSAAYAGAPEHTPSGLIYESLKDGSGQQATPAATVQVHYRGTNEAASFPLSRVIPCWTEGVAKMREGGKAKLICPPEIAYGSRGAGGAVPPNATLTFEVELLKVTR